MNALVVVKIYSLGIIKTSPEFGYSKKNVNALM